MREITFTKAPKVTPFVPTLVIREHADSLAQTLEVSG